MSQIAVRAARADLAVQVLAVVGFAALTALAAQIRVPLPNTPVPMTLQTLAVTLSALTLGPRLGSWAMALYLAVGAIGVPVFADLEGGISHVFGATGGYLVGFVVAQWAVNLGARRGLGAGAESAGWRGVLAGVVLGHVVVLCLGVAWLWGISRIDDPGYTFGGALSQGLWPFLPGAAIKIAIGAIAGPWLALWSSRRGW